MVWIVNSLSSLLSTNVLSLKRLCKIGYLSNPDGYINGKRLCCQSSQMKRLCSYEGRYRAARAAKNGYGYLVLGWTPF